MDWQDIITTAIAVGAALLLLRKALPGSRKHACGCDSCPASLDSTKTK